jgi:hypothetical protein
LFFECEGSAQGSGYSVGAVSRLDAYSRRGRFSSSA